MKYSLLAAVAALSASCSSNQAEPVVCPTCQVINGPSRVVSGATVDVGGTRVRLKGVDASGPFTPLGKIATQMMIKIVNGSVLTCRVTGEKTFDREVGYCFTAAGVDINKEIIVRGAALACPLYETRYMPFERPELIARQKRASYCVKQ